MIESSKNRSNRVLYLNRKKVNEQKKLKESFESCVVLENLFEKRNNETTSKKRMSETKNCVLTLLNANRDRHGRSLDK